MAAPSRLTQIIVTLYAWQSDEIDDLADDLFERRRAIWEQTIRARAQEHGCSKVPHAPRREDLRELRRMSDVDARSIANTWETRVRNQVERLYSDNPRGNRQYYISNLERWAERNRRYHNLMIGNYTEQSVVYYASDRFRQQNGIRGQRYIYVGPPPVGEECIRRFAAGIVDEAYVQRNATPAHPNCPHRWQPVNPERLPCDEMWVG